ncbi:glycosyltransferase family 2 protein [Microbulbifer sp. YPW16]|uniref:glycosyltransferase family 2 protein n=1 Tax=Microbulbifer sp. YPW16 TaxID=2904242 RepID=UPI001E45A34E|nr:glycosyltransferase family 2 protein [Microbulbifer sp. YPW16]UHQ56098.1 glycosyltransferase family 2 protein [Microbulbifer sp. YPW16]
MRYRDLRVALAVPCFNEEGAIRQVIRDFRNAMPELEIYVFDNRSQDQTAAVARAEGATVISVDTPGKGSVVRRMFADVDPDILVMVDGDATYLARAVTQMVDKLIDERLDMVVGSRSTPKDNMPEAYRRGHQFGNQLLTSSVKRIFGGAFSDMLSGYRVFTRRYIKSFPATSQGFEIETELTIHALELRMPSGEVPVEYGARPVGTESKLSTYRDGWRILRTIVHLYIAERPLSFYSLCALLIAGTSIGIFVPVIFDYMETGLVERFPTAILSASMMICALLSLACGLILDNVVRGRQEAKRMAYLAIPHPASGGN